MLRFVGSPFLALALFGSLGVAGCASPSAEESPSTIAEPLPFPPVAPGAPAIAAKPDGVAAPSRGARKERMERAAERAAERTAERPAERAAPTDAIVLECIVRLPDDPTENRELCRSFRMTIEETDGGEATRFRFGLDGSYRFAAKANARYRLKTATGKNWLVSIEPSRDLVLGDRVRVELKQKE